MPKLLDFQFNDFRDWFITKKDKDSITKFDTLIIRSYGKIYKLKVPYEVATVSIQLPINLERAKTANFMFENFQIDFYEIHFTPFRKNNCIITIKGFNNCLIETKYHLHSRVRTWKSKGAEIMSFKYNGDSTKR